MVYVTLSPASNIFPSNPSYIAPTVKNSLTMLIFFISSPAYYTFMPHLSGAAPLPPSGTAPDANL